MLDSSAPAALVPAERDPAFLVGHPVVSGDPVDALEGMPKRRLRPARAFAPPKDRRWLNPQRDSDPLLSPADLHKLAEGYTPSRIRNVRHDADIYANRQFCQSGIITDNVVKATEARESPGMDSDFPSRLLAVLRARELVRPWGGKETAMVTKVSAMSGVGSSTILRYLEPRSKAQRPSAASLNPLARALGTSTDYLLDGVGPMLSDMPEAEPVATEAPTDVFTTGERRFREWVSEREPQHAEKVPEFLRLLAERRFERWSAKTSALDVEEDLIKEFRAWRRGEWDEEPEGVPYVPSRRTKGR